MGRKKGPEELRQVGVKLNMPVYEKIENISNATGDTISDVIRNLIEKGLTIELGQQQIDTISQILRQQIDIVMKPYMNRMIAVSVKGGVMSAATAFLNAQAMMDLVPDERRKDAKEMFTKAKAKGAVYMKAKLPEGYLDNI